MKRVAVFFVCVLALIAAASRAIAENQSDLREMRRQCADFIQKSDKALREVQDLYVEATKNELVLREGDREAFKFNDLSIRIWQVAALVYFAQDILLASRVEAGIALTGKSQVLIYGDALRRFPGVVPDACKRIVFDFADIQDDRMREIGRKMEAPLQVIEELFKAWPGEFLKNHINDEPSGRSQLPDGLIRLASVVDETTELWVKYLADIPRAESTISNVNLDYVSLFRQTQRSGGVLSILVPDTFMLAVAKGRLSMQKSMSDMNKKDVVDVDTFFTNRIKRYEDVLDFYKRQCAVLGDAERLPCNGMEEAFDNYLQQLKKARAVVERAS